MLPYRESTNYHECEGETEAFVFELCKMGWFFERWERKPGEFWKCTHKGRVEYWSRDLAHW